MAYNNYVLTQKPAAVAINSRKLTREHTGAIGFKGCKKIRAHTGIIGVKGLISSFCVVPEFSYSSNAPVSNLLVAWSLNCSIAASSTKSMVVSFKNLQFHLEAFEFTMIACYEHHSSMLSYFTDHASSPRPPLPPLFSLTISKKKAAGTSHKKVF